MIPKISVLLFGLGIYWVNIVYGATYSRVYVENGPDVIPLEYATYGAPPISSSQLAELSTPPVGAVLPLQNMPCVGPCIVPAQTIATVAAVPPRARLITYKAPNGPTVVVPRNNDNPSYEYSYVVYDENTGDKKAQRELSDGSVVRGEYSFIQPDGYVREVKYTADDLTGFNAVVTNFLPENAPGAENKKPGTKEKGIPAPPCSDKQSEAIKAPPEPSTPEPTQESNPEVTTVFVSVEAPESAPGPSNEGVQNIERIVAVIPINKATPVTKSATEPTTEVASETSSEATKPAPKPNVELVTEILVEQAKEPIVVQDATSESIAVSAGEPEPLELSTPENDPINCQDASNTQEPREPSKQPSPLSYNELIKCIQTVLANGNIQGSKTNTSPLTYIILPGNNIPC